MTLFETLKLVHILAAIVWVGGSLLATVYALRARKGDQGHRIGLARDLHFLGNKVFAPASGVALIFGIWMVIERPTFAFGDTWIIIGLIGLAISGTIGGAFFGPKTKALVARLEGGDAADSLMATITRVALFDDLLLLIVVWAMVVKPGL